MSNEMKLIMESWRRNVLLEQTPPNPPPNQSESTLTKVVKFFTKEPTIDGFDITQTYPSDSYGNFAKTTMIIRAMHEEKVEVNKNNIAEIVMGIASAGATVGADEKASTGKKAAVGVIGVATLLAGAFAGGMAAMALGVAGVTAYAFTLIKFFDKNPSKADKHPFLSKWRMDEKWRDILDDGLEKEVEALYREKFMKELKDNPRSPMETIDTFLQKHIQREYDQRNVTKPTTQPTP